MCVDRLARMWGYVRMILGVIGSVCGWGAVCACVNWCVVIVMCV